MLNEKIGKYRIIRLIGEGGMASVYEAEHEMLGTKAAIKVLNPILSSNDQIKERFRNEAKLMASLDHPNITKIIDFDEQPQQLSIVMEYLSGEDLNKKIKRNGPLPEVEIEKIFRQTLAAFQYAHDRGIIYRDIKPSNIFILPNGQIKILDFGIAKLFGQGNEMTQTGTQLGTPVYMSPEQVRSEKSIDHRSDIYSLGVTMFFAVNGKPPYNADTDSQFDIFTKIVYGPLPDFQVASRFKEMVLSACQKKREDRIQTCSDWILLLNQDTEKKSDREEVTVIQPVKEPVSHQNTSSETTRIEQAATKQQQPKQERQTSVKIPVEQGKNKSKAVILSVLGVIGLIIFLLIKTNSSDGGLSAMQDGEPAENSTLVSLSGESTAMPVPVVIETPDFSDKSASRNKVQGSLQISQLSCTSNDVTDVDEWFARNNISVPTYTVYNEFRKIQGNVPEIVPKTLNGLRITDGFNYDNGDIYFYGPNFGEKNMVLITDATKQRIAHLLDFSNFRLAPNTLPGEEDYVNQSVNWAIVEDDILYVSHGHSTYAKSSYGQNAYISAIDLKTYKIKWTTDPLTCNSNFVLSGDAIICGYGFTEEPDYMYVIDKSSGQRTQRISISSGPDYIIQKDNLLYVRTYNTDCVFQINGGFEVQK